MFRSRKRNDFTGGPVPARPYLSACDALIALGLLQQSRSIWGEGERELFLGTPPRLWPTQALLDIAARHGVTPATLAEDFGDVCPTQPPTAPEPVQMFTLKQPLRTDKAKVAVPGAVRSR